MARPFLLRTRWVAGHFTIVLLVIGMGFLSHWQFDRLHARRHRNSQTHAAMTASPLTAIPTADTQNWRSVHLSGTWNMADTELLRYPLYNGQSGYEVITPLVTVTGSVPIDRGWIPIDQGKTLLAKNSASASEVTIDGWYRHAQKGDDKRSTTDASIPTVTKITAPFIQLMPNHPAGDIIIGGKNVTPITPDGPDLSEGPHWSYALQWISFCIIAIGGWATLLYRVWRDEQTEQAFAEAAP